MYKCRALNDSISSPPTPRPRSLPPSHLMQIQSPSPSLHMKPSAILLVITELGDFTTTEAAAAEGTGTWVAMVAIWTTASQSSAPVNYWHHNVKFCSVSVCWPSSLNLLGKACERFKKSYY